MARPESHVGEAQAPSAGTDPRGPGSVGGPTLLRALAFGLALSAAKGVVGLLSGSLTVLADALLGLSDSASTLVALLRQGVGAAGPDRDHPYGHQKVLALGALACAALPLFGVVELVQSALERLLGSGTGQVPPLRLTTPWLLALLGLVLGQLLLGGWLGARAAGSGDPVLRRRGQGVRIWSAGSLLALAALLLGRGLSWNWMDLLLPWPLLALQLLKSWSVLQQLLPELEDRIAIAPEAIHSLVMAVPGVLNAHDIGSRGVLGQLVFVDMHLVVDANDLPTAHRITELVEERLAAQFGPVRCTIHLEPLEYASRRITFHGAHG